MIPDGFSPNLSRIEFKRFGKFRFGFFFIPFLHKLIRLDNDLSLFVSPVTGRIQTVGKNPCRYLVVPGIIDPQKFSQNAFYSDRKEPHKSKISLKLVGRISVNNNKDHRSLIKIVKFEYIKKLIWTPVHQLTFFYRGTSNQNVPFKYI